MVEITPEKDTDMIEKVTLAEALNASQLNNSPDYVYGKLGDNTTKSKASKITFPSHIKYVGENYTDYPDFNEIKENLILYCGNNLNWQNMPPGISSEGGILEAFFGYANRGLQRFTERGVNSRIFVRAFTASGISDWTQIG